MSEPTRTQCFFMMGRLSAVKSIMQIDRARDEIEWQARIETVAEIIKDACELIESLAPEKYTKTELDSFKDDLRAKYATKPI
jgi:hypothetical protein